MRYDLNNQETQLSRTTVPTKTPYLKDACNCIQFVFENGSTPSLLKSHPEENVMQKLFICDFEVEGEKIIYVFTKRFKRGASDKCPIVILTQLENGTTHKYLLNCDEADHKIPRVGCIQVNASEMEELKNLVHNPFGEEVRLRYENGD